MELVDVAVPLHAGPETSVAATKSYIASLSCIAQLVANWTEDRELARRRCRSCPSSWRAPGSATGAPAVAALRDAVNLFVVARGFGLGVAQEAALKLKETCGLHAEAFSSAEVKHGPMALVRAGFPGAHVHAARRHARRHRRAGGRVRRARRARPAGRRRGARRDLAARRRGASGASSRCWPSSRFYGMANALALARGLDPDRPPHLHKVTETV